MPSRRRNLSLALSMAAAAIGMLLLAYASVPLYRLFCQVTGFGGTTQQSAAAPEKQLARTVTVRFNADTDPHLPWDFYPGERQVTVHIGESRLTHFVATNTHTQPTTGISTFNVTPHKAGPYFNKVQCFCFENQTLNPGQTMNFPVSFFIDPAMAEDPDLDDVTTITLSYTFFPLKP